MKIKGKIFTGTRRGEPWIEKFKLRLITILGIDPFKGTLNIKLDQSVKLKDHATKTLDHLLLDGRKHFDAYFMEVKLITKNNEKKCWAMQDATDIYPKDVIELISDVSLKEELKLKDDEEVEIDFPSDLKKRTKIPGFGMVQDFLQKEHRNNA